MLPAFRLKASSCIIPNIWMNICSRLNELLNIVLLNKIIKKSTAAKIKKAIIAILNSKGAQSPGAGA